MERIVKIYPAFDKRSPDQTKNYGIHGAELCFIVKGPKGVIVFTIYTNWFLKENQKDLIAHCKGRELSECSLAGYGASISYHAPVAQYHDQEPTSITCDYLDKNPCYCDSWYSQAKDLFNKMVEEGEEVIWQNLEEKYNDLEGGA